MRTNLKKLAVFVAVFSVAIFMTVTTASAGGQIIQGEYAVVGSGQCAMAPFGIDSRTLLPIGGGSLSPSPVTYYEGVYKFLSHRRGSGNGSASLTGKGFNNAGGPNDPVGGWVNRLDFDFNFTVEDGAITFTTISGTDTSTTTAGPGTGGPVVQLSTGPQHGNISPSGDTLLIHCGAPVIISIVNAVNLGFPPEMKPELICNITLNGFRQWPHGLSK
jgi:hypothetical protein